MGVLTSRYDIYQDVMNPANFPKLRGVHGDWTTRGLAQGPDARRRRRLDPRLGGRRRRTASGIRCGVLCDRQAVDYARRRIPAELKTHPYRCRFIDTTTASPWRECYHPDHPMTRSESRRVEDGPAGVRERGVQAGDAAARRATTRPCPTCTTSRAC